MSQETRAGGVRQGDVAGIDADGLLKELTTLQHLSPRKPLGQVVSQLVDRTAVCPVAADRALGWLGLDASRSVGRLRRGELSQLSRAIHRFWVRALAAEAKQDQPAQPHP
jgi:hypothetical protein